MDREKWVEDFAKYVDKPFYIGNKVYVIKKAQPQSETQSEMGIGLYYVVSVHYENSEQYVCSIKCNYHDQQKVEWGAYYFNQFICGELTIADVAKGIELYSKESNGKV